MIFLYFQELWNYSRYHLSIEGIFLSKEVYERIDKGWDLGVRGRRGGGGEPTRVKLCWVPSGNYSYLYTIFLITFLFVVLRFCLREFPNNVSFFPNGIGMTVVWFSRTFDHEQRTGCELPASNCAEITGSLHVKFCRATSARYNNGRPPACWIAICFLIGYKPWWSKHVQKKILILWALQFKGNCLFSSSLLEMVCYTSFT